MRRPSRKVAIGIGLSLLVVLCVAGYVGWRSVRALWGPRVPDDCWLELRLSGAYRDSSPALERRLAAWTSGPSTLHEVREVLRKARFDRRIRGLLVSVSNLGLGWAGTQELRDLVAAFKQSGKPVVAYLESAGSKEYYVAAEADKVYLSPMGTLLLNGLSVQAYFLKDALDLLGVKADMYRIGEYKSATEVYTRRTFSDAYRESLESVLEDLYGQLVDGVAQGRNLARGDVEGFIDDFSFSPSAAVEARLLDGLLYYDQVLDSLKRPGERTLGRVSARDYMLVDPRSVGLEPGARVAVLYIDGELRTGRSGYGGLLSGRVAGAQTLLEAIEQIGESGDIDAVVVRVSTPGGSALAADVVWRELTRLRARMPVVVSMSDMATSGGYWIATAGRPIVAQAGTLTGSIGVLMGKFDVSGLVGKVGANVEVLSRGRYAQILSPMRAFTEEERGRVEAMLQETYDTFVDRVSTARGLSPAEVDAVGRGRVWTGRQALARGLVDRIGGLSVALEAAREAAGIPAGVEVDLVPYPARRGLPEVLAAAVGLESSSVPGVRGILGLVDGRPGPLDRGVWAIVPFRLVVE